MSFSKFTALRSKKLCGGKFLKTGEALKRGPDASVVFSS